MKKILSLPYLRLGFLIFSSMAAVLQLIAAIAVLEKNSNYFASSSPLPILAVACALLGAACGTLAAYKTNCADLEKEPFSASALPSHLSAVGFLAVAVLFAQKSLTQANTLTSLITLVSLVAAVYAFLSAFSVVARKSRTLLALLGFAAVLSCILANAYYYFDATMEMNAPFKVSLQTALLCASLYFTGEIRFHLKRKQPRFFLVLATWTVALGALSAPAIPIAFLIGRMDRADYAVGALSVLLLAVSAGMRMHALLHPQRFDNEDEDAPSQEETTGEDSL